jgi:DNA-binding response OmpR family regulator
MTARVLLCDDDVVILKAAQFKLAAAGLDVECASDGQCGWEAIQRQRPDLLITDCQMPRLNGLELIQRVRSSPQFAGLPIFMLTGKDLELPHDELIHRWKVREVLGKPFSPRELLSKVIQALQETGALELAALSAEDASPRGATPAVASIP